MQQGSAASGGWDIYAIALSEDPHARWREIRESEPVLDTGDSVFFVSEWERVNEVLRDARHGAGIGVAASFGATEGLAFDAMGVWLMSLDGAPHTRARGLVRKAFTPRSVEGLRGFIERTCAQCVEDIAATPAGEGVDLIPSLALRLPSEVIRTLFGFRCEEWKAEIEPIFREGAGIPAIEALANVFQQRIREDRVPPGLLADLRIPDEEFGVLSELEVVANAVLFVTAAIDTTAGLIGNAIHCLLERPGLARRLGSERGLAEKVVEETLRFEPPALSCSRTAGLDFELGGVAIPGGSHLLLGLGAANRDPARYAEPDVFDVERDFTQGLSFGGGRHFCVGTALARLEAQIAIEHLFRAPGLGLELEGAPVWQSRNPTIRALSSLRVQVGT